MRRSTRASAGGTSGAGRGGTTQGSPLEAIRAALERERHAVRVYTEYANCAGDAAVREMFRLLAEEERKHAKLLSDEIEKESLREM